MVVPQPPMQPVGWWKAASLSVARNSDDALLVHVACKQNARSGGMEPIRRVASHQQGPVQKPLPNRHGNAWSLLVVEGTQCLSTKSAGRRRLALVLSCSVDLLLHIACKHSATTRGMEPITSGALT